jgi:glycyl-tRNA synthetase beta chain
VRAQVEKKDYTAALKMLAGLRATVDAFFDQVMVNAEEPSIRANRLALLSELAQMMNAVADISRLSV